MEFTRLNAIQFCSDSEENRLISSLDPLKADEIIRKIPTLNKGKDITQLISAANSIMPSKSDIYIFNYFEANAATRDIGILLGSLKRHRIEPNAVIHDLEDKLNSLAAKTCLPPRDTLLHYTVWNPAGNRRRTYTGTVDENYLIDSVVIAMQPLVDSIHLLKKLHKISVQSRNFKTICNNILKFFEKVVEGIVLARRKVCPSYFAKELRLYFDPIILNDQQYLGPGAVEMPMFVFDHLLWSSDCTDHEYSVFKETYVPYIHIEMRKIYYQFEKTPSLLSKCCNAITKPDIAFHPTTYESLKALRSCFYLLKSFRMPHKKVAEEAYNHSNNQADVNNPIHPGGKREYRNNGSGGYSPSILTHIVDLTDQNIKKLDECILIYQKKKMVD